MKKRSWRNAIEFAAAFFIVNKVREANDRSEESQSRIHELENRIKKIENGHSNLMDDYYDWY